MSQTPAEDRRELDPTSVEESATDPHTLPDLDAVQARIDEAKDAEHHLEQVMPSAIDADDDAYEGMSGPTEGDVEETDPAAETDDERDARSEGQPVAEQVQEDVTGTRDDAEDAEDADHVEETGRS